MRRPPGLEPRTKRRELASSRRLTIYSGQFHLQGQRATLVGHMQDSPPWDHLDYAGKHLTPVQGTIDLDVNERTNTGNVVAEFVEGADRYRIVFDHFAASQPY